jgi:hypothetical protein
MVTLEVTLAIANGRCEEREGKYLVLFAHPERMRCQVSTCYFLASEDVRQIERFS